MCCGISGSSPSKKKPSFPKIVFKPKHRKDKPGALEKGELVCFVPRKAGTFTSQADATLRLYFGHLRNAYDAHATPTLRVWIGISCRGIYPWVGAVGGEATRPAVTSALNLFSPAVAVAVAAAAAERDSILLDPPFNAKTYDPGPTVGAEAQGTTSKENLVGSQKRKARKNKIIHLVRTADGTVSLFEGEEALSSFHYLSNLLGLQN